MGREPVKHVLVCGSRQWTEQRPITDALNRVYDSWGEFVLIHGQARGADRIASGWATWKGLNQLSFPANWPAYGSAAGPIRNNEMLVRGKPDLVLAFPHPVVESPGTRHMISIAQKAGVKTVVFDGVTQMMEMK